MLTTGTQFEGLKILEHCGSGGFGTVYLCEDPSGKRFALKVISKDSLGNTWERELKGIRNYRKLSEDTPGLLKLYHVGENQEYFYYTMEPADAVTGQDTYVADTLARRLDNGPLPSAELIQTLEQLLSSIQALHDAGLAHRDIKPDNIIFINGKPKLADLGLLSMLSGTISQLAGTLDFIPPEERGGGTSEDNHTSRQRNDLYAFGKVIYCCVTGNNANRFPSYPHGLPLTLNNRAFFQLSRELCDEHPRQRLTDLQELQREFQRAVHICQFGEKFGDKLCYYRRIVGRNLCSFGRYLSDVIHRHKVLSSMLSCLLVAGGAWGVDYFRNLPDAQTRQIARTIHAQKNKALTEQPKNVAFTFYNGMYSMAIPADWNIRDHETLLQSRQDRAFQRLYGVFSPKSQVDSPKKSVVYVQIIPVGRDAVYSLNDESMEQFYLSYINTDAEMLQYRRYERPRLSMEIFNIVGQVEPGRYIMTFLIPREDHTLALTASVTKEHGDDDLISFAGMFETLEFD